MLLAKFEHGGACYFGLGAKGKSAERVADEAVDWLEAFLRTEAVIDQYLADQVLIPLSFAKGESIFSIYEVTQHLLTNAEVIRRFSIADIHITGDVGEPGLVRVQPLNQSA